MDTDNPENTLSKTGYIIYYAGFQILWTSKLQTEIALSTAESKYITLTEVIRGVLPWINILTGKKSVYPFHNLEPVIKCKIYDHKHFTLPCPRIRYYHQELTPLNEVPSLQTLR